MNVPGEALATAPLTVCGWARITGQALAEKDNDGDISAGEILLKRKALIAGDERFDTGLLGFVEQLAV